MRINPAQTTDILAAFDRIDNTQGVALRQLSSGVRVSMPGDDPADYALAVSNHAETTQNDQFLQSCSSVQAGLATADSALSSVVSSLERAITLGVSGANGTVSDSQKQAIANEVLGIRQTVLNLANTSYHGTYVFAGTASNQTPFVADASAASGIAYVGNSSSNQAAIGRNQMVATSLSGDQIFTTAGADVFAALQALADDLEGGSASDIGDATTQVRAALDHVTNTRVFYGDTINRLEDSESYLNNRNVQLASEENDLIGTDMAATITKMSSAETARESTLAAVANMSSHTLFDYLK